MELANWHTFQVLTKRSNRMRALLSGKLRFAAKLQHVWWGVSVEDKKYGLPRIAQLRKTPARTRFLSIEPLLEDVGELDLGGVAWVIVGGESGAGARPLHRQWVRSIRDQCVRQSVAFFFKQWGGVRKGKAGRELDRRTYDDVPVLNGEPFPADDEYEQRLREAMKLSKAFGPKVLLRVVPA